MEEHLRKECNQPFYPIVHPLPKCFSKQQMEGVLQGKILPLLLRYPFAHPYAPSPLSLSMHTLHKKSRENLRGGGGFLNSIKNFLLFVSSLLTKTMPEMEKASLDTYKDIVFSNSFQINNTPLPQVLNSYFFIIRRYILEISSNGHS